MKDIVDAKTVEITVDQFGKIWVNVDGTCALRIGHAETVVIDDPVRGVDAVVYDHTQPYTPAPEDK